MRSKLFYFIIGILVVLTVHFTNRAIAYRPVGCHISGETLEHSPLLGTYRTR